MIVVSPYSNPATEVFPTDWKSIAPQLRYLRGDNFGNRFLPREHAVGLLQDSLGFAHEFFEVGGDIVSTALRASELTGLNYSPQGTYYLRVAPLNVSAWPWKDVAAEISRTDSVMDDAGVQALAVSMTFDIRSSRGDPTLVAAMRATGLGDILRFSTPFPMDEGMGRDRIIAAQHGTYSALLDYFRMVKGIEHK